MKRIIASAIVAVMAAIATPAFAQTGPTPMTSDTGMYYASTYDWRLSKFIGSKVVNSANEQIGDINDVVFTKDGKVAAVIVGVGGFLGMGERNVAVSYPALQMSRDANGNPVVTINATKESLRVAPEWKWQMTSN